MMKETNSVRFQFRAQLAKVFFQDLDVDMHQRVEAEHEVDTIVRNHVKRTAVVYQELRARSVTESCLTSLDAIGVQVDADI